MGVFWTIIAVWLGLSFVVSLLGCAMFYVGSKADRERTWQEQLDDMDDEGAESIEREIDAFTKSFML